MSKIHKKLKKECGLLLIFEDFINYFHIFKCSIFYKLFLTDIFGISFIYERFNCILETFI